MDYSFIYWEVHMTVADIYIWVAGLGSVQNFLFFFLLINISGIQDSSSFLETELKDLICTRHFAMRGKNKK